MYGSLGLAEALAERTFADLYPEGTKSMRWPLASWASGRQIKTAPRPGRQGID